MSADLLAAFALFAFVSSVTPGPNNLMLMASGANFGFRRSVPHMLGIALGFVFMVMLLGLGLGRVLESLPLLLAGLRLVSFAYLAWLAWRVATSGPPVQTGSRKPRPLRFFEAAAFQWINPKAWAMALSAITLYAPGQSFRDIALVAAIFGAINLPSVSVWTVTGRQIRHLLADPRHLRLFNFTMAGLLIASLLPVLLAWDPGAG